MDTLAPAGMLARLASDGRALRDAATDLDAAVPTCPGWTVRDAVDHTAVVYLHKATILENDSREPLRDWDPDIVYDDVRDYFDEQLHRIIEALRTRDPATAVWTWYEPEQNVGFWVRRMMQETVIHRADVESAQGAPSRVDDAVAVDGVDELLVRMLAYDHEAYAEAPGHGEQIAVRAGDVGWTVTLGTERATITDGVPAAPTATVEGAPSDVLLALWNRLPYDAVRTSGDPAALATLRAAVVATTQ